MGLGAVARKTVRGCRELPFVGPHPGSQIVLVFTALGALAGHRGGVWGALGGALFMALFIVPMYVKGAYDRAVLSERHEA